VAALKSRVLYIILGLFLGTLGLHNFYLGRNGPAVAQLLITVLLGWWLIIPLAVVGIWAVVEVITITTDGQGRPLQ